MLRVVCLLVEAGFRPMTYRDVKVAFDKDEPFRMVPLFDPIKDDPGMELDGCNKCARARCQAASCCTHAAAVRGGRGEWQGEGIPEIGCQQAASRLLGTQRAAFA